MMSESAAVLRTSPTGPAYRAHFTVAFGLGVQKTRGNIQRLADQPTACPWAVDGDYFAHPEGFFDIGNWTTSFFTGMAMLSWRSTGEEFFLRQAARLAPHYRLKVSEHQRDTMHDLGFLYSLYSVPLFQLTGKPTHKETGLCAAQVLADRFVARGGYLQAWGRMDERNSSYAGLAIIDSMMNLPLLYWASAESGNSTYREIAIRHADTTLRYFIRDDDSVCHAFRFAPLTGKPIGVDNYCGYGMDSHWARGTAWAIYGFALSYAHTGDARCLQASLRLARQFLKETATDPIPVWDFHLPASDHALQDSSAAAIAACGFQELSRHCPEDTFLIPAARRILDRLCQPDYLESNPACPGLLRGAQVNNGSAGSAISVYASWGDYFFLEALSRELGWPVDFWFASTKPGKLPV